MRIDLIQGSPEWLEWRHGGIGGSDIAAIMGLSPFKDAVDVYNEKKGISVPFVNDAMRRGTQNEPRAREAFERAMDMKFPATCWQHDEHDFCRVSLDGYNDDHAPAILEIKVTSPANYDKLLRSGDSPPHYVMQVQWQLLATGCDFGWLVFFDPATSEYFARVIGKDELMQELMLAAAKEFWEENILMNVPPDLNKVDDYLELTDEGLKPLCEQYLMFREMGRVADLEMKGLKPRILDFSDAGNFRAFGVKATWKNSPVTYDMEAMKADGVDVEKYKKSPKVVGYFALTKDKK